jgi:LysM repeat protein
MKRTLYLTLCLSIALAALLAAPVHAQGDGVYVVQPGDTLTHIAARHGLTATQLAQANGLSWNAWVYTGQRLRIPGLSSGTGATNPAPTGGAYVVQRGDSLSSLSRRYGLTVEQLAAANNLGRNAWVYAGQRLRIPGAAPGAETRAPTTDTSGAYIVRPGDTLLRIAMFHGLTVQRLAMANGMHVNAWVYIGQRLQIPIAASQPGAETRAPTSTPAVAAGTYVVRPGDSLIGIAVRHGISVSQLAAANGLQDTAWVYVGQRLRMPGAPQAAPQPAPQSAAPQSAAPQPANPPQPESLQAEGAKWIDVNLTAQTLTAYVGDQAVLHTKVSTGTRYTPTVVGTYRIYSKYVSTHMSGPGYSVPNVPHAMFFYGGYSLHGTYWHSNFGTPMSHGCVNLPQAEAKWLFEWAPIGTKVVTHY